MTVQTIAFNPSLPNQKFKVSLSGTIYTLLMTYNVRMNRWIMSISDAQNNQILVGVPLLINRDMTGQYTTLSLPPGVFIATDDSHKSTQPTQFSFNIDHTFNYLDPST